MRTWKCYLIAAVAVCVPLIGRAQTTAATRPDRGTPRAAAKAFLTATQAGDADAIRECLAASGLREARAADAASAAMAALVQLRQAAAARFGAEGERTFGAGLPTADDLAKVDAAPQRVEGNQGSVELHGPEAAPLPMCKLDGEWRVSVRKLVGDKKGDDLDADISMLEATARAAREIGQETARGMYSSAAEAAEALQVRVKLSGTVRPRPERVPATTTTSPATRPSTQPAPATRP